MLVTALVGASVFVCADSSYDCVGASWGGIGCDGCCYLVKSSAGVVAVIVRWRLAGLSSHGFIEGYACPKQGPRSGKVLVIQGIIDGHTTLTLKLPCN